MTRTALSKCLPSENLSPRHPLHLLYHAAVNFVNCSLALTPYLSAACILSVLHNTHPILSALCLWQVGEYSAEQRGIQEDDRFSQQDAAKDPTKDPATVSIATAVRGE